MPNQHLNGHDISDNTWTIATAAEAALGQRLLDQSGLSVSDSDQAIHSLESIVSAEKAKFLLVLGDTELADIEAALAAHGQHLEVLFVDFPLFTDGRGYSLARLLKRAPWFKGKLAAIGDVLQDQVFFYWRCGFDIIVPRQDQNIQRCQEALKTFSHTYQPAVRQPAVV